MPRSLTRCQFVALAAGVVLCLVQVGWIMLLRRLPEGLSSGFLAFILHFSGLLLPPAIFAFAIARYAGSNRGVAYITCIVPAVFMILVVYIFDIKTWGYGTRPGVMLHVLGYVSPFDLVGQVVKALPYVALALFPAIVGIGFERLLAWKNGGIAALPAPAPVRSYAFVSVMLGLVIVLVVSLAAYISHIRWKNTPAGRVTTAEKILNSSAPFEEKARALTDLQSLRGSEAIPFLRDVAARQPAPLKTFAAALLVGRGDLSFFPLYAGALRTDPWFRFGGNQIPLGSMLIGVTDPAQIPFLLEMLQRPELETRRSAVYALRQMENPATIPAMLAGLSDADENVRYHCVYTLQQIAPGPHALKTPSVSSFAAEEKAYLDYWQQWARSHGYLREQ